MIVVGVCAGAGNRFDIIAGPALSKHAPDTQVIVLRDQLSIASAYNQILDTATRLDDLEAVVLLHDDVEIVDPVWRPKLLRAFASPGTAVVGVIGASGKGGMAWFTRANKRGAVREPGRDYDFGDRFAARVDLKSMRVDKTLEVRAVHFEEGVDGPAVCEGLARELHRMARWLGHDSVNVYGRTRAAIALRRALL